MDPRENFTRIAHRLDPEQHVVQANDATRTVRFPDQSHFTIRPTEREDHYHVLFTPKGKTVPTFGRLLSREAITRYAGQFPAQHADAIRQLVRPYRLSTPRPTVGRLGF